MARKISLLTKRTETMSSHQLPSDAVIFVFDGACSACNKWVKFLVRIDMNKRVYFASRTSPLGLSIRSANSDANFFLKTETGILFDSDALIEVLTICRWPFRLSRFLRVLPVKARDAICLHFSSLIRRTYNGERCGKGEPGIVSRLLWE